MISYNITPDHKYCLLVHHLVATPLIRHTLQQCLLIDLNIEQRIASTIIAYAIAAGNQLHFTPCRETSYQHLCSIDYVPIIIHILLILLIIP